MNQEGLRLATFPPGIFFDKGSQVVCKVLGPVSIHRQYRPSFEGAPRSGLPDALHSPTTAIVDEIESARAFPPASISLEGVAQFFYKRIAR
ncbi:MAG: hypothetical protein M3O26_01620 [Pseudomonadota bacterium]|nr:hypothetical protein [Pseudomonadota bacterium]